MKRLETLQKLWDGLLKGEPLSVGLAAVLVIAVAAFIYFRFIKEPASPRATGS